MHEAVEAQVVEIGAVAGDEAGILTPPGRIADHRALLHWHLPIGGISSLASPRALRQNAGSLSDEDDMTTRAAQPPDVNSAWAPSCARPASTPRPGAIPAPTPDANFNLAHMKRFIQTLERGRFDAFFMADHLAVLNMPMNALKRSHTVTSFEPFTLLSALAMVTDHIGLIATGSTTFEAPFHIARRFASLDHISGGRAAWNIVTTSNPDSALNFGLDDHMEHDERYRRAREFYDVVTGLWDSWAEDAFIRNVETGEYFDPSRMHVLDHKGEYLIPCAGRCTLRVRSRAGR